MFNDREISDWAYATSDEIERKRKISEPSQTYPGEADMEAQVNGGRGRAALDDDLGERYAGRSFAARASGWGMTPIIDLVRPVARPATEWDAYADDDQADEDDLVEDEDDEQAEFEDLDDEDEGAHLAWEYDHRNAYR